ncbi:hypothetical protein GCM10011339_06780 [Echinicola rosea]|uniref:Uncharacterized protein n=2 Tax=Echinicola rosea TaxID=1807691 RepID=A0ABQ1ULH4_9BACT|nr:hypothetical protein GCM10011339_06780 [Echinicola rosea]
MNSILRKGNYEEHEVAGLLEKIQREKDQLQSQYDEEGDHGLNWGVQRYWEYKIDSLLSSFRGIGGKLVDEKDIKIYLPYTDAKKRKWKNGVYDMDWYWLEKYDMMLSLSIIKSEAISTIEKPKEPEDGVEMYNYAWDSLVVLSKKDDSLAFSKRVTAVDTLDHNIIEDLWIKEEGRMYRLSAEYPIRADAQKGFLRIVNSYFNSFEIVQNER